MSDPAIQPPASSATPTSSVTSVPEHARGARELPGWSHAYSGKVRDLYVPETCAHPEHQGACSVVLIVASDRLSAFDQILPTPIPDKGAVLTALSRWWFARLNGIVVSHELPWSAGSGLPAVPEDIQRRATFACRLEMVPVECIVRGYLTGSGLAEYRAHGTVCGIELPTGLTDGDRLPEPIFTPSRKAELGEHDENVSFDVVVAEHGEVLATRLRDLSLAVYIHASEIAQARGIILADTKVEFGVDPGTGELVLGDEVLTPDSSRFWDAATWRPGGSQPSFDKQFVRDWLASPASGWSQGSGVEPPEVPDDVVRATRSRYVEAYERLTGERFASPSS